MIKVLKTKRQALGECNKILKRKKRFNCTLDNELFEEAYNNAKMPVFAKGIEVEEKKAVSINSTLCTQYVLYNPYMVYLLGNNIATCVTDTISQVVIFVDDVYMGMTSNTKKFIEYHELAHIILKHKHVPGIRDIEQEYAADAYASNFSDAKEALFEIKKHTRREANIEMLRRIRNINSNMKG